MIDDENVNQNPAHKKGNDYAYLRKQNTRPMRERVLGEAIHIAEYIGLLVIAIATMFAGTGEIMHMIQAREVTLGDLLLLFLYLEVLAMIGVYLKSGKLPIRFPHLHCYCCLSSTFDSRLKRTY